MMQNIRNRLQIMKQTHFNFYKLLPLVFVVLILFITLVIGIADPNPPPVPPPGGSN